jgi:riboflavin kinase/FMN adenylyltransferase
MSKIATIGFFDGVHRGHRFLFAQLQEQARQHDLSPVIYTFKQHPKLILTGQSPAMLTTMDERLGLLETFAQVSALDFASVQHLTAEQFMRYLFVEEDVRILLMGYDHSFGSDRLKGFSEYEKIARKIGLRVLRAHECLVDGLDVSSTRIRKLLNEGNIHQANRLLGYTYTLKGLVEHGNGIGNQIGFPTANISLSNNKKLPMSGVYAACVKIDEASYKAVVNIGTNPTVGNERLTVEVHILDYQDDLYGCEIEVAFVDFIREERKFDSLQALQEQIAKDVASLKTKRSSKIYY